MSSRSANSRIDVYSGGMIMNCSLQASVAAPILALGFAGLVAAGPCEDGLLAYGLGDYATALRILRPLADQGNADAQISLAVIYAEGQGVPKDLAAAARWYQRAADQGHVVAQSDLGAMYYSGEGVPQDYLAAANGIERQPTKATPRRNSALDPYTKTA